ncbi:single-stranded DNA-binding protein [Streptomyces albofaciens JCM 4342]|uniref:single-stranded DNA-binding protein n=1 Tax=Streptomyces albofaciens TaxID=66866 RepID=UPI00123A96C2|nr:single-stranded DNA-binding protein [Streptomyces albofaciens]KAA6215128.1 single-stranded DNA-binding protein [Streptomyces albofaciens JCM 4342]KAA6220627.1 single-stranded DNA-binding protein [Streptomyces albofaciens JCM 4342]
MSGDTTITMVGNVVADPELRFTPSGAPVCNFRMANTPRKFNRQANEWEDGEPLFLSVAVWRQQAEHVAESIQRGTRVIVVGRLTQRQYEDREGKTRSSYEIQADEVAPSLLRATAVVTKAGSAQGAQQPYGQQSQSYAQQPAADQWSTGGYRDEAPF